MTKDTDLLPCPGCEGTTDLHVEDMSGAGGVICTNCGMSGPTAEGRKNIISAWNALPRSRPSGLALEWDERDELWSGDFLLGYVLRTHPVGWSGAAGTKTLDGNFSTREAAQAAVERAVRSALGGHIADAGKMVLRPMMEAPRDGSRVIAVLKRALVAPEVIVHWEDSEDPEEGGLWFADDGCDWEEDAFSGFLPLPNTEGNDG